MPQPRDGFPICEHRHTYHVSCVLNEDVVAEPDLPDHLCRHICPELLLLFGELPQPLAGEDILCADVDGPWEARAPGVHKNQNWPKAVHANYSLCLSQPLSLRNFHPEGQQARDGYALLVP